MVYNALAEKWHGGYERSPLFCILLIKLNAMQRQRHHTPGTLVAIKPVCRTLIRCLSGNFF